MTLRLFSTARRAAHLGPYPLERLERVASADLTGVPDFAPLNFARPEDPVSILNPTAISSQKLQML